MNQTGSNCFQSAPSIWALPMLFSRLKECPHTLDFSGKLKTFKIPSGNAVYKCDRRVLDAAYLGFFSDFLVFVRLQLLY